MLFRSMRLDSNAVDVGTFRGELLGDMIEVAPAGRHIGFEPLPSLHAALVERFANDRVTVHPLALGETPGKLTFTHVVSNPGYSGFREKEYDRAETTEEIEVEVETLDRMLGDAPDVDAVVYVTGENPPLATGHIVKCEVVAARLHFLAEPHGVVEFVVIFLRYFRILEPIVKITFLIPIGAV